MLDPEGSCIGAFQDSKCHVMHQLLTLVNINQSVAEQNEQTGKKRRLTCRITKPSTAIPIHTKHEHTHTHMQCNTMR